VALNYPWNLNSIIPNSINRGCFNGLSHIKVAISAYPGWVRSDVGLGVVGLIGETINDDSCQCD